MSVQSYHMPYVVEKDGNVERVKDIYTRLLQDRIVFLRGPVDPLMADLVVAQLLFLAADDPNSDINMYISSPGGSVSSGLSIFDTMNYISCDVSTICIGGAYSMGAFLLAAGALGKRSSTENARIMIHQPSAGAHGQVTDMDIQLKEANRYKDVLTKYLAEFTGQKVKKVRNDCERDFYMSPQEALEYGLIDKIQPKHKGD